MPTYETPGVYVEEISTLPASVAQVATAIPAFVGYTEKAEEDGENLTLVPTRLGSLVEYQALFGGAPPIDKIDVEVNEVNAVKSVSLEPKYFLYDSLRLFFDNGGGDCYIVSVGSYEEKKPKLGDDSSGLKGGLKKLEKYDEPTLILFPDAVLLDDKDELYTLQQATLLQCNNLQDRFAVFDLVEKAGGDDPEWEDGIDDFRNKIGINYLKYGAAYTPWLKVGFPKAVKYRNLNLTRGGNPVDVADMTGDEDITAQIDTVKEAVQNVQTINTAIDTATDTSDSLSERYQSLVDTATDDATHGANVNAVFEYLRDIGLMINEFCHGGPGNDGTVDGDFVNDVKSEAGALSDTIKRLIELHRGAGEAAVGLVPAPAGTHYDEYDDTTWGLDPAAKAASDPAFYDVATNDTEAKQLTAVLPELQNLFTSLLAGVTSIRSGAETLESSAEERLKEIFPTYRNIVAAVNKKASRIPPSGAIVGVYSSVDRDRGVWKAPANVSLNRVNGVSYNIDHDEQAGLNVDPTAGKSINAIRPFTGKGILVWGARTLAGNDNEWRYVPVRRFFNMVEESIEKASAFVVFEPNTKSTWVRVKGMIENYLTGLWRQGALAGAVPEQAFFVNVGLGETMTAQDILEGRMIIEVGLAAVRPAEFIILRFSHKLQEA